MTKVFPFSEVKILPELLRFFGTKGEAGKTSTFRPAFKMVNGYMVKKEPRFAVGDLAQAMWNQRTSKKGSWFCSKCGELAMVGNNVYGHPLECLEPGTLANKPFPKIIGTVKVGSVSEFELFWKDTRHMTKWCMKRDGVELELKEAEKVVLQDGFGTHYNRTFETEVPNMREFFQFFDETYDLSTPKPFYRYGDWRYIA